MSKGDYPPVQKYVQASEKSLGELVLAHERKFVIPLNQRPWSWQEKTNVQAFLNDFWETVRAFFDPYGNPKWSKRKSTTRPHHFFGTFVFYAQSDQVFEVFDGQQRLTAVVMLCSVLRELAHEQSKAAGDHQAQAADIYGGFGSWLTITPASPKPRLMPNSMFRPVFDALVFDSVSEDARSAAIKALPEDTKTHLITRRLISSYYYIREWLHEKLDAETPAEKTRFLLASYDTLRELFSCVEAKLLDEEYAYEVFQSLNTKGERLTTADNIKNELFKESSKSDHKTISTKWNQVGENVPEQDVGEFLRRRHITMIAPCKKSDTYLQVRDGEIRGRDVKKVVEGWLQDSIELRKILDRKAGWAKKETISKLEAVFDILNVHLSYIPILAAAKSFLPNDKDKFHECVSITECFVFRALTIGGMDTAELERKLGEAARKLSSGGAVPDFRNYLKEQSDDLSFSTDFSAHVERRSKVQYYILSELERHLLGGGKGVVPGDHHSARNHIEHILPKTPSKAHNRQHEWSWARSNPDLHQSMINRLGNLMVLESDINKGVSSHEFDVKRTGNSKKSASGKVKKIMCYADSDLVWPARLCDSKVWPTWEAKDIEERQKQMAQDALKVWLL